MTVRRTDSEARARRGPFPTIESSRERERLRTVVLPAHDDLASLVADRIVEVVDRATRARGKAVLGLATGSTPLGVYNELIRRHQAGDIDFSRIITFNLDEYYPIAPDNPHSYHRYMWENFFEHVNIARENVHILDGMTARDRLPEACAAYEQASSATSRTRLVTLDTLTRKDAAADFFGEENVPREAITMGVATILEAREVALIATGEHKAAIVSRAVEGDVSADVAATFLQRHASVAVYLDLAAAADLTRIKTPWVLEQVDWTPPLVERAVVWLAERTGKAVLKLSARDYAEHQLSPLLARFNSAGPINGQVFNRLRDKIRGRAKLPAHERVLVFSPHPDDDVISMGGILRKLWENENAIVVAYMTSGNIAVFDHDVTRHLDFVERAAESLGLDSSAVQRARSTVNDGMEQKAPGDVDIPVVQNLKKFIRESEAIAALAAVGIPASAARFLDLPFYRTGEVRKRPLSEDDIAIVLRLIEETRPDLVFVAGDLSDP